MRPRRPVDVADVWAGLYLLGMAIVLGMLAGKCVGCAHGGQAARLQTAVTTLAEVIDPSYDLAVSGCIQAEQVELEKEQDAGQLPVETDRRIAQIRGRCDHVRAAFDGMVTLLAEAEKALKQNEPERAEVLLEKVRGTWRSLAP